MIALEMLERGFSKAGPRSKCEGCPFAGSCTPCRPRTSGRVFVVESIKDLLKEEKLPVGTIYFGSPERQGSGGPPRRTGEKTCSICQEVASACGHSKSKTSALAAA